MNTVVRERCPRCACDASRCERQMRFERIIALPTSGPPQHNAFDKYFDKTFSDGSVFVELIRKNLSCWHFFPLLIPH